MSSQPGTRRGKLLVIIVMVAAVGIAVSALFFMRPTAKEQRAITSASGARATGDQFMKALGKGEADTTFNFLTEAGKLDVGGQDKWSELVTTSFAKTHSEPTFLSEHGIDDPSGIYEGLEPKLLTYRLPLANVTWETSVTVIKDQDTWKIDRVSSDIRQ